MNEPTATTDYKVADDDLAPTIVAATWPDEILSVELLEWRTVEVFNTEFDVPVIKVTTNGPADDDDKDWARDQIEAVIGDDRSVMWVWVKG